MAIPAAARQDLADRLDRRRRDRWPQLDPLTVRYSGNYAYVGLGGPNGQTERLFRLSWTGSPDAWGFARWHAPDNRYVEVAVPPDGTASATPEDALDRASSEIFALHDDVAHGHHRLTVPPRGSGATEPPVASRVPGAGALGPETSTLKPFIRAVRAHRLFVALFILAALAGSVAILELRSPTYTATAKLLVTPVERGEAALLGLPLIQELGDPTRTIQTAASVVKSGPIAAATAEALGAPWTETQVVDAVDVVPQGQTNVLAVEATADGASEAAELATAYAIAVKQERDTELRRRIDEAVAGIEADLAAPNDLLPATVETLQTRLSQLHQMRAGGDPTISLSESAVEPRSEDGPPGLLVVLIAVLAAAVLAPGAALVVELLGPRRLMDEDDLVEVYPLPVLARVPRLRSPANEPAADPRAGAALRRLRVQMELGHPHPRTVTITSPSRGDGRTSSALSLAAALAEDGSTVLLIDLDTAKPDLSRAAVGEGEEPAADGSGERANGPIVRVTMRSSLFVVGPRPLDEQPASGFFEAVCELLTSEVDATDYVVIDTPPLSEMTDALRLVASVDAVILVARLGHTTRRSVEVAREFLATTGIHATGFIVIGASL